MAGIKVKLTQTTDYPWQGNVRLSVAPTQPVKFTVRVRIPGWAQSRPVPSDLYAYDDRMVAYWSAHVGSDELNGPVERGFLAITREWRAGDAIELNFGLPVRTVRGHPQIGATKGRIALERGPLVYCVEDVDFSGLLSTLTVPELARFNVEPRPLLGGMHVVTIEGARAWSRQVPTIAAVPYFAWNNRGTAPMAVWLERGPQGLAN